MTVRQRILTIKLSEKIKSDPEYAKKIGIKSTQEKSNACKTKNAHLSKRVKI